MKLTVYATWVVIFQEGNKVFKTSQTYLSIQSFFSGASHRTVMEKCLLFLQERIKQACPRLRLSYTKMYFSKMTDETCFLEAKPDDMW